MANAFKDVITRLERQKAAIDRALLALREVDDTEAVTMPKAVVAKTKRKAKGKRPLSAEARSRMAAGQKRRWAAKKAAESATAKKRPVKAVKKDS